MNDYKDYLKCKYKQTNLISDPIYGSIKFTSPFNVNSSETTERDIIDSAWLQRLRNIHQLQSTFWVFPGAEHSRFQHSLGTMHLAGEFATHLYPDFCKCFSDCPSIYFVEELMRISGLLHDVGHGPFGHMFDVNYLVTNFNKLNHEIIGEHVICEELGDLISRIRRSPNGNFNRDEVIDPEHVGFIINQKASRKKDFPIWLEALRTFFCGTFFTVDNLDYVLRDSYFTGYSKDPINLERILYYTSVSKDGLVFSSNGKTSFKQFLNIKTDLFNSVYYHRTVRAIDLSIASIFNDTMQKFCPFNPIEDLESYKNITEQELFCTVRKWNNDDDEELKTIGAKWKIILQRKKEWFEAWRKDINIMDQSEPYLYSMITDKRHIQISEENIYKYLESRVDKDTFKKLAIQIDTPIHDPRPNNPFDLDKKIRVLDYGSGEIKEEMIFDWLRDVPQRIISLRVYTNLESCKPIVNEAATNIFTRNSKSIPGNL
jgi:HD superfamily phosphohydrolase